MTATERTFLSSQCMKILVNVTWDSYRKVQDDTFGTVKKSTIKFHRNSYHYVLLLKFSIVK